jgi:hypothetical protein
MYQRFAFSQTSPGDFAPDWWVTISIPLNSEKSGITLKSTLSVCLNFSIGRI